MNLQELEALLEASHDETPLLATAQQLSGATPVKLVPRATASDPVESPSALSLQERLHEIEMAQRLGYLLCKCSWPPQIMVLTGADHVYRCRRCSRVREM